MQYRKADRTFHLTPTGNPLADISETGARLILDREFKVKEAVTLEIKAGTQSLTLKARVIRSAVMAGGKFDTGLHYEPLPADAVKTLRGMIEGYGRGVPLHARIVA